MKVPSCENVKVIPKDDKPSEIVSSRIPYSSELDTSIETRSRFNNFSKNFFLTLAIVATFLACVIFARELCRSKAVESEVIGPLANTAEKTNLSPMFDELMNNFPMPLFDDLTEKSDDPNNGKLIKRTKITFRIVPKSSDESGSPPEPIDDLMKMLMNVMRSEDSQPSFFRRPSSFEDVAPFRSPVHPKLIIIRKMPSPFGLSDSDSDQLGNPFSSIASRIFEDITRSLQSDSSDSQKANSWNSYRRIVSNLVKSVNFVLEKSNSLKSKVQSLFKGSEVTASSLPESYQSNMTNDLEKIENALTTAGSLINSEDAALDLISDDDKERLTREIDSFINSLDSPLNTLFTVSSNLAETNQVVNKTPPELQSDILQLNTGILDLGKLVYEDLTNLAKTVEGEIKKTVPVSAPPSDEPTKEKSA